MNETNDLEQNDNKVEQQTENLENLRLLLTQINTVLIGQEKIVKNVLLALLANGHVLLEGVPGLGKTFLVRAMAKTFAGDFKRIQFTPDLMPSDVTGHVMFDMANKSFEMKRGPVFTPLDQEGTYPLPEAELDRFLIKVVIDFPSEEDEIKLTKLVTAGQVGDDNAIGSLKAVMSSADILTIQQQIADIEIDDQVVDYAVRIVRATRNHPSIFRGAGSRAGIALVRIAKANAYLEGRNFVLPDDVKLLAVEVLQHRIALMPDVEIEGLKANDILAQLLSDIEAPRK